MLEYYGRSFTQTSIALYGTGGVDTWNYLYGSDSSRTGIDLILLHFGSLSTTPSTALFSLETLTTEINAARPLVIRWGWDSGGGHFVVARGVDGATINLMDPWYGPTINSYDWVCAGGGHTWTHTLKLNTSPPAPPVITGNPQSLTNNPDTAASFTVTASGSAPLRYQWQKNGINLGGATGTSCSIAAVAHSDEGHYRCLVSNMVCAVTSTAATLTVKLAATVTLGNLTQVYDGAAKTVTATTVPAGLQVDVTYDGHSWAPTNAGSYAVAANIDDAMYQGSASGTLLVTKAAAAVTLNNLRQTYNGTARSVTATTVPAGLAVGITYDGHAWAPTNAGSYALIGTIIAVSYAGTAHDTLVVAKANQSIAFPTIPDQVITSTVSLSATAGSGLPVTFAVESGPAMIDSGTSLSFTGTGQVSITASQTGNANWNAALPAANTFMVSAAPYAIKEFITRDFDGDNKADPALYRETSGDWSVKLSASGYAGVQLRGFGGIACAAFAADFDGDGKADPGIYNMTAAVWQVKLSGQGYPTVRLDNFGEPGSAPVTHDFDGDGKADPAVYNTLNGDWRILLSASGYGMAAIIGFGGLGYTPVSGHFDSDPRTDPAAYGDRTGHWRIMLSSQGYGIATLPGFGGAGFDPLVADFDGDGRADLGIYKASQKTWLIKLSGSGYGLAVLSGFGGAGYVAGAADFDGDGKADPVVYQSSTRTFFIKLSASGYAPAAIQF